MAISIIGTPKGSGSNNGGNVTLTFDASPNNPQQNDYVLVYGGYSVDSSLDLTPAPGPSTAGYTTIQQDTTGTGPAIYVGFKKMGASPDSNVVCQGSGDTGCATAYGCVVLRGADLTNFQDQTAVVKAITSGVPDCSSITTQTANAWVFAIALEQIAAADTTRGSVSGYTDVSSGEGVDTLDTGVACVRKTIASPGADDPAAWSTWTSTTYRAVTIAVRPELVLTTGTTTVTFTAPTSTLLAATTLSAGAPVATFTAPTAAISAPPPGDTLVANAAILTYSAPASTLLAETALNATAATITSTAPATSVLAETTITATAASLIFSAPITTIAFDQILGLLAAEVTFTTPSAVLNLAGGGGGITYTKVQNAVGGVYDVTGFTPTPHQRGRWAYGPPQEADKANRYRRGVYVRSDEDTYHWVSDEILPVGTEESTTPWEIQ